MEIGETVEVGNSARLGRNPHGFLDTIQDTGVIARDCCGGGGDFGVEFKSRFNAARPGAFNHLLRHGDVLFIRQHSPRIHDEKFAATNVDTHGELGILGHPRPYNPLA